MTCRPRRSTTRTVTAASAVPAGRGRSLVGNTLRNFAATFGQLPRRDVADFPPRDGMAAEVCVYSACVVSSVVLRH